MSANILKLAYVALTNVSEAFTRALDVLLPRSVPMYVIRFIVACGWGAFALLSASRLIYGVVVIGAVLCLAVALGNDDGADAKGRAAGMYEYATDSTPRGRRRREDFDERRRAAARERKRRSADFEYEDIYGDGAFDAFDAKAFERGAEVFSEAFGDRLKAKEAFRAAQDVTVEVRQWGDEALDEFKKAFNLNAGDFDFEDDVAEVDRYFSHRWAIFDDPRFQLIPHARSTRRADASPPNGTRAADCPPPSRNPCEKCPATPITNRSAARWCSPNPALADCCELKRGR